MANTMSLEDAVAEGLAESIKVNAGTGNKTTGTPISDKARSTAGKSQIFQDKFGQFPENVPIRYLGSWHASWARLMTHNLSQSDLIKLTQVQSI